MKRGIILSITVKQQSALIILLSVIPFIKKDHREEDFQFEDNIELYIDTVTLLNILLILTIKLWQWQIVVSILTQEQEKNSGYLLGAKQITTMPSIF